jgi:hypothetical protein
MEKIQHIIFCSDNQGEEGMIKLVEKTGETADIRETSAKVLHDIEKEEKKKKTTTKRVRASQDQKNIIKKAKDSSQEEQNPVNHVNNEEKLETQKNLTTTIEIAVPGAETKTYDEQPDFGTAKEGYN